MSNKLIDSIFSIWLRKKLYSFTIKLSKTKVKYHIEIENDYTPFADKPIIFACNHSAFPDTPIALRAIKRHCYVLSGKQNLNIEDKLFFFLAGAIWVDRQDKNDTLKAKTKIIEYLKKGQPILWFPEATWNLTTNLLMLPMRWGIIEVAQSTDAQIIPIVIDYDFNKMLCKIKFGNILTTTEIIDKKQGIEKLRDEMATLKWDFITHRKQNRSTLNLTEEEIELNKPIYDYPPINWDYEQKCIYQFKNITNYEKAFNHLENLKPSIQNAFLFNKRLK